MSPGTDVGADGLPVCDEFACQTWGCWCDRAPEPECEHGVPISACLEHPRIDIPRRGQP
jgi:hypothetical protein